jgi:cephalosporin hydroxylase
MSAMRDFFDKYECDKGKKHGYEAVYEPDFEPLRNKSIKILDVGVFKGASVQAWLDYFPKATVYGIDIFTRLNPEDVEVLQDERVKWIKGDSMSEDIVKQIRSEWGNTKFDIIIDDGKHTPEANRLTFQNLFQFLKKGGKYYVEDVWPLDIMTSKELGHPWIMSKPDDYNHFEYAKFENAIKDHTVTKFDLRNSAEPDSYIIKIE